MVGVTLGVVMNRVQSLSSAVFVTVALVAVPAFAQGPHSRGSRDSRGEQGRPAPQRETSREAAPAQAPRAAERPAPQAAPRVERQQRAYPNDGRRSGVAAAPRYVQPRGVAPRFESRAFVGP